MKTVHKKYEARDFAWNLTFYKAYGDPDDEIWTKIIKEAKQAKQDRQRAIFFNNNIPDEYPFVQGDKIAQGLPDVVYECEEFVMGIEMFQFDASGKNRNGSKMKVAELEVDRKAREEIRKNPTRPLHIEEKVNVTFSYSGYIQSLTKTFTDHAKNIEQYISKLKLHFPNKKIYLTFYIEDITAIGNYIIINGERYEMIPIYVRDFVDLIEQYPGIDYLLFKTQDTYIKSINIHTISDQTIDQLRQHCYDMSKSEFYEYSYKRSSNVYSADDSLNDDSD